MRAPKGSWVQVARLALVVTALGCSGSPGASDSGGPAADAGVDSGAPGQDAGPDAGAPDAGPACRDAGPEVDCGSGGACPTLAISGDAPATTPGLFKGFADPTIARDPDVPGRFWLAYTWPHISTGQAVDGGTVLIAATALHLARSDNSGASFSYVGELWPKVPSPDPEGSGQLGILNSEVASLASIRSAGTTTWYGSRQRYFQQALTGYNPKYSTSWVMRIAAAPSPQQLTTASDTVLGVSTAAAAYQVNVYLDQLAALPITRCAMLNNPALFTSGNTLYLILECLAFVGPVQDYPNSTVQVFATNPSGAPTSWTWRYVGKLADATLAQELGSASIKQPDVSLAADGTPILVLAYGVRDPAAIDGVREQGCVAIELTSIDPPALRRDCANRAVIRAKMNGERVGMCAHAAGSSTGIIGVSRADAGGFWTPHSSGLKP